jgi:hypothetical protein
VDTKLAPLELNDDGRQSLSQVLGIPEAELILTESAFAEHFGCSNQSLETELKTEWVQHDIRAVLSGKEKVGPQPWLVLNQQAGTVRLFSPSEATLLVDARREIELAAPHLKPGQPPISESAVLAWWDHVEQTRKLFMDACRVGRAHNWPKDQKAAILQCVAEIEKRIPTLNSRHLWDVRSQSNAIEKCAVLCCEIATYCEDVANIQRLAELITHNKNRWAALGEAIIGSGWLESHKPLAYLNRTAQTIYRKGVRPDQTGWDSQGVYHRSGKGGATKPSDGLHEFNDPRNVAGRVKKAYPPPTVDELAFDYTPKLARCVSLDEIVEISSEIVLERRFTQDSVRILEEAAREDPHLAEYFEAVSRNPKRKRADIWRELGLNKQDGKAVDRKFRRLRERLRAKGAGMEWYDALAPGTSDASRFVYFEVLHDGAKGPRRGVFQHKSLKINGK